MAVNWRGLGPQPNVGHDSIVPRHVGNVPHEMRKKTRNRQIVEVEVEQVGSQMVCVAAILTPRGRGAVATIRFRGDLRLLDTPAPPLFQAANRLPLAEQPVGRICFGHWGAEEGEEVVVCRTGEGTAEIHCHGGDAASAQILHDLQSRGCQVASWCDFALLENDVIAAESQAALAHATTMRTAAILLEQFSGVLRSSLERLLALAPSSAPRTGLGVPDRWVSESREEARQRLTSLLNWSEFGRHLTEPWSVVLAGRPNVGKSSLINALLGYNRSIVHDQPGTTRDVVIAETAFDGWPVRLSDTAGLRAPSEHLESSGIFLAQRQLEQADCLIVLVDLSQPPDDADWQLIADCPDAILVAHKSDLPDRWQMSVPEQAIRVSSVTGDGLEPLIHRVVSRLMPELPPAGTAIPFTERQTHLLERAQQAHELHDGDAYRSSLQDCLGR